MKKIVIPFEGASYHGELLEFVKTLNTRSKIFLTVAFMPMADYVQLLSPATVMEARGWLPLPDDLEKIATRHSQRVVQFCEANAICCHVHMNTTDFALPEIQRETRFADILLVSSRHFFDDTCDHQPNTFMRKTLHDSECPVLLVPAEPSLPGSVMLAYDGTPGSVQAIRQFAHLFPEFANIPTILVYLSAEKGGDIPERNLIRELGNAHFRNFRMLGLSVRSDEFYDTWIGMMSNPWLVAGAFGRSGWSRLFSHSFVHRLITEHKLPLFVAHG